MCTDVSPRPPSCSEFRWSVSLAYVQPVGVRCMIRHRLQIRNHERFRRHGCRPSELRESFDRRAAAVCRAGPVRSISSVSGPAVPPTMISGEWYLVSTKIPAQGRSFRFLPFDDVWCTLGPSFASNPIGPGSSTSSSWQGIRRPHTSRRGRPKSIYDCDFGSSS